MRIQLVRKLAEQLDGVDLTRRRVGDVFDLPEADAALVIAERWAVPTIRQPRMRRRRCQMSARHVLAQAADAPRRRTIEQLRRFRQEMECRRFDQHEHRRAEDRIRDELRDLRATIVGPMSREIRHAGRS